MSGKRAGPPVKLALPASSRCPACNGKGMPDSVVYEMVCATCEGAGKVNAETGEALDSGVVIVMLRRALQKERWRSREFEKQLATTSGFEPHGDLKPRDGGLYRGD